MPGRGPGFLGKQRTQEGFPCLHSCSSVTCALPVWCKDAVTLGTKSGQGLTSGTRAQHALPHLRSLLVLGIPSRSQRSQPLLWGRILPRNPGQELGWRARQRRLFGRPGDLQTGQPSLTGEGKLGGSRGIFCSSKIWAGMREAEIGHANGMQMTWLVCMLFRDKDWGALCEGLSPERARQTLLVAWVTAILEALLGAGASLAQRRRSLQDGKESGPRLWEDSAVTCSATGGRDTLQARSQTGLSGPRFRPPPPSLPSSHSLRPGRSGLSLGSPLLHTRRRGEPGRAATPPHLDRAGPQTGHHRVRARGSLCTPPPSPYKPMGPRSCPRQGWPRRGPRDGDRVCPPCTC